MSLAARSRPRAEDALAYLDTLYRDKPQDAYVLGWTLKGKGRTAEKASSWFVSLDDAAEWAAAIEDRNVYVGMAFTSVKRGPSLRYEHEHAAGITCLRIDVDTVGPTHEQTSLPPDAAAARALLAEAIPLEPTMVVATGGGIQAYWCFREPWVFESDDERELARDLSERFQNTIIARAAAHDWILESTADLPRVMRVPGTYNRKGTVALLAAILELDDDRRYNPSDVEPYLLEPPSPVGAADAAEPDAEPRPIGYAVRNFVEHGAGDGKQRPMLLQLARSYWGNHRPVEEAQDAAWRAIERSPQAPDDVWTEEEVRGIIADIYSRKPSKPWQGSPPIRHQGRLLSPTGATPTGHADPSTGEVTTAPSWAVAIGALRDADDKAAVVRAVLTQPETLGALAVAAAQDRGAYEEAMLVLGDAGVRASLIEALKKAVNAERKRRTRLRVVDADDRPAELTRVRAELADAPVPDAAVVPAGWRLDGRGVAKVAAATADSGEPVAGHVMVAPAPIVIAGRLTDVAEGTESTRLAWYRDGRWRHHTTARATIANARALVDLAGYGLPVTSATAGDLVQYLAAFEAANLEHLPRANVSRQMGWQGERGGLGFLWGRTLLRATEAESVEVDLDELAPEDWREDWVGFKGADAGDDQLAEGFHAAGSLEAWRAAVAPIAAYPRVMLALYGSLAPTVLAVFGAPNFGADWSYATSTGKTTVLRLAASCWGCPDERAPAAALSTWDGSRVWIERASAVLNSLPLILDDTKRARNPRTVAQTIYDVTSGHGRGRGSPKGMRRTGSWCSVLLSTGEAPATSFTEDGGTRARVLSIWGMPWGQANETTAPIVHRLNLALQGNYGHAGPRFVQFLLANRDLWEEWAGEYREAQSHYLELAAADPIAARFAAYFATLHMTARLAHVALGLPWEYGTPAGANPIGELWTQLIQEASEGDRASAALAYVVSWAMGHRTHFYGRQDVDNNGNRRTPSDGLAGRWDEDDDWAYLGFFPHRLRPVLESAGYEPEPILRLWRDRGWLKLDPDGKQHRARVDGDSARLVAITREAIDQVNGDAAES